MEKFKGALTLSAAKPPFRVPLGTSGSEHKIEKNPKWREFSAEIAQLGSCLHETVSRNKQQNSMTM